MNSERTNLCLQTWSIASLNTWLLGAILEIRNYSPFHSPPSPEFWGTENKIYKGLGESSFQTIKDTLSKRTSERQVSSQICSITVCIKRVINILKYNHQCVVLNSQNTKLDRLPSVIPNLVLLLILWKLVFPIILFMVLALTHSYAEYSF